MIVRIWRGLAHRASETEYVEHLRAQTLPQLSRMSGYLGASVLKRNGLRGTEFLVVTRWESTDAIRQFAGDDVEVAVVPSEVGRMMIEHDARATHYEEVLSSFGSTVRHHQ